MKTEIQGSLFILVNYYGPNTQPEQVKILKEIDNHLKNLISGNDDDANIIFWGDFNMYFDCHLDALGGFPKVKQDSCHTVKLIMSEFDKTEAIYMAKVKSQENEVTRSSVNSK